MYPIYTYGNKELRDRIIP
jgi:glutaryl-CoA dehydrogenase